MLAAVSVSTNFRTILVYVSINNVWCISIYQQILAFFMHFFLQNCFAMFFFAKSFRNFFLQKVCKNK